MVGDIKQTQVKNTTIMKNMYTDNVQLVEKELKQIKKQINNNSLLRLLIIIVGGILLFKSFGTENITLVFAVFISVGLGFLFLVAKQSRLEKQKNYKSSFLKVNQNELNISNSQLDNVYGNGSEFEDDKHPYSSDLDVFGSYSLFAYINRCATVSGKNILASWFSKKQELKAIKERQQAVDELSRSPKFIQSFQTLLFPHIEDKEGVLAVLTTYLQRSKTKFGNKFLIKYVLLAPWISGLLILLSLFYSTAISGLIFWCIFNLGWTLLRAGQVSKFSSSFDKLGNVLNSYSQVIAMIEEHSFSSNYLVELKSKMEGNPNKKVKLSIAVSKLGRLINKLDSRNNLIVGAVLNMLLMWDFKYTLAIQGWVEEYDTDVIKGVEVISEFEGLNSFAVLKYNHPTWIQPTIYPDYTSSFILVRDVHHPLIPVDQSVGNDFSMEGYKVGLITGSNMAGKSTFLRTVGINAVLAYAGAVVHATMFELPLYSLVTYMRIKDSLQESTSTFKAELDRMKFILDQVGDKKDSFFLIDEMFRGTNSVDKYLGSEAVIKKLVSLEGQGLVATHDLQLSSLEKEMPRLIRNFHFDIKVEDGDMHFDYKLKEGECKVFNASMLLKNIGVEIQKK